MSDRIKQAIEGSGLTMKAVADSCGIPYRTLQDYVAGKADPSAKNLSKLATGLRVSAGWLLLGEDEQKHGMLRSVAEEQALYGDDFVLIPQVCGEAGAGKGVAPDDAVEMRVAFRKDWISKKGHPDKMSLIKVKGDSMEPTLFNGDLVLVDHGRNVIEGAGGIYALALDDEVMVKRLQVTLPSRELRIMSDNAKYETYLVQPDQVRIVGKVIWFGRELER